MCRQTSFFYLFATAYHNKSRRQKETRLWQQNRYYNFFNFKGATLRGNFTTLDDTELKLLHLFFQAKKADAQKTLSSGQPLEVSGVLASTSTNGATIVSCVGRWIGGLDFRTTAFTFFGLSCRLGIGIGPAAPPTPEPRSFGI